MTEVPLFITDPSDGKRKHVGTKQVHSDGTCVWFRRISNDHVMRSGSFGVDAMTYETQFAGKPGKLRVELGSTIYEAPFEVFDRLRKEKDLGHGRQYFLAFAYWQTDTIEPVVSPTREQPKERLTFGEHRPCRSCSGKKPAVVAACLNCHGVGYVAE